MSNSKPWIVIIDDDITIDQPLVGFLQEEFGPENIYLFQDSTEGVHFIEQNLSKKIIVLLDIMFNGKELGFSVFHEITQKSTLVCFIVMTGNIEIVSRKGLTSLVNGHAWYIVQRDRPAKEIIKLIKDAEAHIKLRVDGALEEWILRHSPDDQEKPFLKTRGGRSYSLKDILHSLRTGENNAIGQKMATDILMLAVDLLARDKTRIGNVAD